MLRVNKLHQRRYKLYPPGVHRSSEGSRRAKSAQAATSVAQVVCARSTGRAEQTRGVFHEAWTRSTAVTTSCSSLAVESYQGGLQRSTRGEAGLTIRRQECRRLFGMDFQAPRQPVALQRVNLHAQGLDILLKRDGTGITFEGAVSDCDVCAVGKGQQLAHPKTVNCKVNRPFKLCYRDLTEPFKPVAIGGYK